MRFDGRSAVHARMVWSRRALRWLMRIASLVGVALGLSMFGVLLGQPMLGVCAGMLSAALIVLAHYLVR